MSTLFMRSKLSVPRAHRAVRRRRRRGVVRMVGRRASTFFTIDPKEEVIAILLLQHLPRDDAGELPEPGNTFYNIVYQALVP